MTMSRPALRHRGMIMSGGGPPAFDPSSVSAVVGWLRLANATITGSGVSSVPDMLGGPAATQSNDADRPPVGVSANGLPIMQFSAHALAHPVSVVNNGAGYWGMGCWLRTLGNHIGTLYYMRTSVTNVHRMMIQSLTGEDIIGDFYLDNDTFRRARTAPSYMPFDEWNFYTFEYQGSLAGDARLIFTKDNVNAGLNFTDQGSDPTAGEVPAELPVVTGNAIIGSVAASAPSTNYVGDIGPNIFFFNRQLTGGERGNLMTFEAPI